MPMMTPAALRPGAPSRKARTTPGATAAAAPPGRRAVNELNFPSQFLGPTKEFTVTRIFAGSEPVDERFTSYADLLLIAYQVFVII